MKSMGLLTFKENAPRMKQPYLLRFCPTKKKDFFFMAETTFFRDFQILDM